VEAKYIQGPNHLVNIMTSTMFHVSDKSCDMSGHVWGGVELGLLRHIHNAKITCMRIIVPMFSLDVFGVVFWLHWVEINKEK